MSKGNMLLGMARGKVGSLVFSRLNGQQITRAKAEKVSNPRTDSQNLQRAIFATIAKAAQALGAIVDHSFQSVKYGSDSINYFRKQNLGILRSAYLSGKGVDLLTKGADSVVANEYLISQGSLPSVNVAQADWKGASTAGINFFLPNVNSVPGSDGKSPYVTLAQLNARFGIQAGDQITVVGIANVLDYDESPEGNGRVVYARTVLLPDLDANAPVINNTGFVADAIDPNATTNREWLKLVLANDSNDRYVAISPTLGSLITADVEDIDAVAIIVSRYDEFSAKWLRSPARMVLSAASPAEHNTDGDKSAIDSYGNNVTAAASTEYLNQADSNTSSSEIQDVSRGNLIVRFYNKQGSLAKEVKSLYAAGNISIDTGLPNTEWGYVAIKATTFKDVKISSASLKDDSESIYPMSISSTGKQATSGNISVMLGSTVTLPLYVSIDTLFAGGSAEHKDIEINLIPSD